MKNHEREKNKQIWNEPGEKRRWGIQKKHKRMKRETKKNKKKADEVKMNQEKEKMSRLQK